MIRIGEIFAVVSVLLSLVGVPASVYWYERHNVSSSHPADARIIDLTGVAQDGVWTQERVAGYNYWRRSFPKAHIRVYQGDRVILRLKSSDTTHRFYCPDLGIGPLDVEPGHVVEAEFTANSSGIYVYSCGSVCGDCHFFMRGIIEVLPKEAAIPKAVDIPTCPHDLRPPAENDPFGKGKFLYQTLGCVACHEGPGVGEGINVPAEIRYEGSKVQRDWLVTFLLNPKQMRWREDGVRPFTKMPNFQLTEDQAEALATYLMQQTDKDLIPPTGIHWSAPASPQVIAEGRKLYSEYKCIGCHQLNGEGGRVGPTHDGVGVRLQPDFMYAWIRNPHKIVPRTSMKNFELWEDEAEAIVRYLQTLR